ncbi:tRNA U34 5-methylaminomethyl-2-thiouridine-forming methyltransferase MnmC [Cognatiyoonia sediminum]|uniref:tRNA U34 5-methylaminomethyl-2-thiouridine-forming methyltransferase MnmC n=1 Tax=Cognatiyoonia sediminum TaxID=1508389 RepID=A0A1M5PTG5_9RHOB|nr:tRNA (5-methylaminomethyl-2-thiouridine)(34)-methyltransferase MnmD [Cognatiyoonia sediminum]SHH04940.1 tRNA U34 5-methylaminomethyl-2-thiouridine-forming methyltransferase MnmC [Cognatiyoonia sediminum]
MTDQTAQLEWRDTDAGAVPISTRFDDPYYSLDNGLAETQHVFLSGNDLPNRFTDGFHIAELGFGTGLNFLATLQSFRASGTEGKLRFTSFEAYPMAFADLQQALQPYPDLPTDVFASDPTDGLSGEDFDLTVITGDARETLPNWQGQADAWFLDGFSPAKNPELWDDALIKEVGRHTKPNGTFATYTAAGHVRRALTDAGFQVERAKGFGRKRHMSVGTKRDAE